MAFRSSASASSSGGAITATPSGVAVNDILVALYQIDNNSATVTLPSGWAEVTGSPITYGSGNPDGGRMFVARKVATGTDSFQFNDNSGGTDNALICAAFSARDTSTPFSTNPVFTQSTASSTTPVSATITGGTATAADDVAIFLFGDQTASDGRWTGSTITNYTERNDGVNNNWVSFVALQTRDNVGGGATGNFSVTITRDSGTGNIGYGGCVLFIKSDGSGGGDVLMSQICM